MKHLLHKRIQILACAAMAALILFGNISAIQAQTPEIELDGYAWSSNIGWISLNCKSGGNDGADAGTAADDVCATSGYQVVINPDKTITGYAWSSNIGWVRFGGLSGFPNGSGNVQANAAVTGTYPDFIFEGWARACAGTASGANACDNMANNPDSGNWDGWISLKGTNHQLRMVDGVLITHNASPRPVSGSTDRDGFAWGSTVVGWVDMFTRAAATVTRSDISVVAFQQSGTPSKVEIVNDVGFIATITGVPVGVSVDYRLFSGTVSINGTYTQGGSSGAFNPILELDGMPYGTGTIAQLEIDLPQPGDIVESDGDNSNGNEEIVGNTRVSPAFDLDPVPPVITLVSQQTNRDSITVRQGETVQLDWSVSAPYDVNCTAQGNVAGNPSVTHVGTGVLTPTIGSFSTKALTSRSEIRIDCTSVAGTVTRSVMIDMIPNVQEI